MYIADLGFALVYEENSSPKIVYGTPGYVGPEVLSGDVSTPKSDIFSVGVIKYNMLSGKSLFEAKDVTAVLMLNMQCSISKSLDLLNCSRNLKDLLRSLLAKDPA